MSAAAPEGPLDPDALRPAWTAALAGGQAAFALTLRRIERLHDALPLQLGPVRRRRWLCADPTTSTWEGVCVETGQRARVRVRDPGCAGPAVRPPAPSARPLPAGEGAWLVLPGPTLRELCAEPDLIDEATALRWLGTGVAALSAGVPRAAPIQDLLALDPHGLQLVDLGADEADGAPELPAALAALAALLGPLPIAPAEPVGALLRDWAAAPPPSLDLAAGLLRQHLAASLTERRHRLALQRRNRKNLDQRAALRAHLERLWSAWRPAPGRYALAAARDGLLTALVVEPGRVRGGTLEAGEEARQEAALPVIFEGDALDAPRARALLRAWSTRGRGAPEALAAATAGWGRGADPDPVCRWLAGMTRLRAARLLLDAEGRRPPPR